MRADGAQEIERSHSSWSLVKAIGRVPLLPRERRVLRLRERGETLAEVARVLGVTRERVRQIERQARKAKSSDSRPG